MRLGILLLTLILVSINPAAGQQPTSFAVRGGLSDGVRSGPLTVELSAQDGRTVQRADLSLDGSFEFHDVVPGLYELRITNGASLIHRENVFISGPYQPLWVNMGSRVPVNNNGGGTISIRQLQHQVPSNAWKEFGKGQKAADKSDHLLALDHFARAITIDPQFADAYNNLGVSRSALGHLEEAAEAFEKASELVPDHAPALANLSIVLYKLRRFEDCAVMARRALKLNSSLLTIRYLLAFSLSMQAGNETEALENLELAALEIPQARLLAAEILVRMGRSEDAAKQLDSYLQVSAAEDAQRPAVEQWLTALRK